jgi:endonuclease/exonuclease/phosphatase family metal-dependent hydrolase
MNHLLNLRLLCQLGFLLLNLIIFNSNIKAQSTLKVMTWNIRLNTQSDGIHAWDFRKERLAEYLSKQNSDIFGLQEVLNDQLNYLAEYLPEYSSFGIGRTDGKKGGEYSPVFYRTERFNFLQGGNFWLSEQPESVGSKGWDAAYERIVSWVQLFDKESGDTLWIFNTHFDHVGVEARKNSAALIISRIIGLASDQSVVLMGDFNIKPDNEVLKILSDSPIRLSDSRSIAYGSKIYNQITFTGFDDDSSNDSLIDYIFHSESLRTESYKVLTPNSEGFYYSDHLPVVAFFAFNADFK